MSFLIDTNVFLWAAGIDGHLNQDAKDILDTPDAQIFFSSASAWEIAIKWSKGRLTLPERPEKMIDNLISANGFSRLSISFRDALAVADLPHFADHKDPFDRLIVAQARVNGLRLMTSDSILEKYDVDLVLCSRTR